MKIITEHTPASEPYWDNASPCRITVETEDTKSSVQINEGEPEDMTFGRNLNDFFNVPKLIKLAYEAGKRGEELEMEDKEYDW